MTGTLLVCGTPIGNLGDVSGRLREALASADTIACEDTRRTRALLSALGIPAPALVRLDANAEERAAPRLVERLVRGERVALVCDAGMPGVADPGGALIRAALASDAAVLVVPGPSAVTASLALAGLPGDGFVFVGFLPRSGGALMARLDSAGRSGLAIVAFEAPGRLPRTLAVLAKRDPGRAIVVCRELTKLHEEAVRGTAAEVAAHFAEPPPGEVTLVLAPVAPAAATGPDSADLDAALRDLREAVGARRASEIAARLTGLPRRDLYERLGTMCR